MRTLIPAAVALAVPAAAAAGTGPDTHGTGPAPRRRRRAAAALAMLAVPLAVTALTAIPAAAATTGTYRIVGTGTVGIQPTAVAVDSSTHTAYVTNRGDNTVSVPGAPVTIGVGSGPDAVAVDSSTHTAYVANYPYDNPYAQGTVSVINEATNAVTGNINVGYAPDAVAVDPSTDTVYVANEFGNTVSVINGATNTVTATIGVASEPDAVAVDPSTHTVYVANYLDGGVYVINGATNAVTATIDQGFSGPDAVAVDPSTHTVYVANWYGGVSVINGTTCEAADPYAAGCRRTWPTIGVGSGPDGVAVDPSADNVYVANYFDNTVSVIDEATNAVTATIGVGNWPDAVGVDPSTHTAWVANSGGGANTADGSVSVITYNPSSYPTGYHQLVANNSGLCVDVYGASTSDNAAINQYTCKTTGQANQEWQWLPVPAWGSYGELENQNSGKDLVVANASTAAGAKIIQYVANGTTNGQWEPIALPNGSWQFQNKNSGQCLDVYGGSSSPGVQLDQWPCQSGAAGGNQAFATR
jgi:YVTN family beta-propeller protein